MVHLIIYYQHGHEKYQQIWILVYLLFAFILVFTTTLTVKHWLLLQAVIIGKDPKSDRNQREMSSFESVDFTADQDFGSVLCNCNLPIAANDVNIMILNQIQPEVYLLAFDNFVLSLSLFHISSQMWKSAWWLMEISVWT